MCEVLYTGMSESTTANVSGSSVVPQSKLSEDSSSKKSQPNAGVISTSKSDVLHLPASEEASSKKSSAAK